MTTHIQGLLDYFIVNKSHHQYRTTHPQPYALAAVLEQKGLNDVQRAVERLRWMLGAERPVVIPDEKICCLRTVTAVPEMHTQREYAALEKGHKIHEQGKVCNINPSYTLLLGVGTDGRRKQIEKARAGFAAGRKLGQVKYLDAMLEVLDIVERFADGYAEEAARVGNHKAAAVLRKIPRQAPTSLQEALQFLRIIHYCLWCSFNYHNTFGRFDQYMYPYYKADIESGRLTEGEALELLEEFFISCNKDSDLYPGMQQGDNGQSMVLGGLNPDGSESYNALSALCLQASRELHLIDPKINLRVNKNTPLELYERGSELTKQGLGFPQYANDDVIVPALKRWGYSETDAYNYVVAACWEFIVPGAGMDIPNIDGMSFTRAVAGVMEDIDDCGSFAELMQRVRQRIFAQAEKMIAATANLYMEPSPMISLLMQGCVENGRDIAAGGKYNNYGFHGTGLSTAVDSLAAIQKYVYDQPTFDGPTLRAMLKADFDGYDETYNMLRYEAPKFGNDDDRVDAIATQLLSWFADALDGKNNDRGGVFRAGTGSAMYYIWHAKDEAATPDGRKKSDALACNYSPSLFIRCNGPVSIVKSFSKPDLERVANGGPLTIELHDNMFRSPGSIRKVAQYVKSFMDMGGHQMQINAVNRDKMQDAKKHPENYRNLIVRVWGWSGYFVELDEVYQNHIIERMELSI